MANKSNNSRWMEDRLSTASDKTLAQLALPGSHDAGMYSIDLDRLQVSVKWFLRIDPPIIPKLHLDGSFDNETIPHIAAQIAHVIAIAVAALPFPQKIVLSPLVEWIGPGVVKNLIFDQVKKYAIDLGQTQQLSIEDQLACGVRSFDLRPKMMGDKWYLHHSEDGLAVRKRLHKDLTLEINSVSATGPSLDDVLKQLVDFLGQHKELIILHFSHYKAPGFNGVIYKNLIDGIVKHLQPWLYVERPEGKGLADVTLGEYLATGSRVVVLCSEPKEGEQFASNNPTAGIWPSSQLASSGHFSNTDDYDKMHQAQLDAFARFGSDAVATNKLLNVFWTLTVKKIESESVRKLAKIANKKFVDAWHNVAVPNSHHRIPSVMMLDFIEGESDLIETIIKMNDL